MCDNFTVRFGKQISSYYKRAVGIAKRDVVKCNREDQDSVIAETHCYLPNGTEGLGCKFLTTIGRQIQTSYDQDSLCVNNNYIVLDVTGPASS